MKINNIKYNVLISVTIKKEDIKGSSSMRMLKSL